jgi:hypothetical protein
MNKPYESPYAAAMKGIRTKIAMQAIRKIIREDDMDENKLAAIVAVIHEYEDDQERAELEAERKAIEADEAEMRRERINEMFEDMAAPVNKLMDCVKGGSK